MEDQWAQAVLRGDVGEVGAVDATAHANDAVKVFALAAGLDPLHHLAQLPFAALIGVPFGQHLAVEGVTVVADSLRVEGDGRVGSVHHASRTDLVRAVHHVFNAGPVCWACRS